MDDKSEFSAALAEWPRHVDELNIWWANHGYTIRRALLLADKVTWEPTWEALDRVERECGVGDRTAKNVFETLIRAAIEEIANAE